MTDAIYEFLAGMTTPQAERVRAAVLAPGSDTEVDAALLAFRRSHHKPHKSAGVQAVLRRHRSRAKWGALFAQLVTHCQRSLSGAPPRRKTAAGETEVSTVITTHVESSAEQKRVNLADRRQLWPVLLELAAKRLNAALTPKLAVKEEFATALEESLRLAFTEAGDRRKQRILQDVLFGRPVREVADRTADVPENVERAVEVMHDRLAVHL